MGSSEPAEQHLLLLAGSGEAREIAHALALRGKPRVTASILYPPRGGGDLGVPTRTGPFGGASGLRAYLDQNGVTAVLDATHPFAARMSARVNEVCGAAGLPHAQVLRPPWTPGRGDDWTEVPDEAAAAALLKPGQRVFVTTGRATLMTLSRGTSAQILARRVLDREPLPDLANVTGVPGQGPFSVADEVETLLRLRVDVLVVKNSGGEPSRTKLDAARQLGLPVILIARPSQPDVLRLETVAAALDWVARL